MKLRLQGAERQGIFSQVGMYLDTLKLLVTARDDTRPWGGFFVIDEGQAPEFVKEFFPGVELGSLRIAGKLSPKLLVVQPHQRLSWQYHHRRAEIWRVISPPVAVVSSFTDEEGELRTLEEGDIIRLAQGQRHRLIGLDAWGIVAEIWQHTTPDHPSDENDIIRVQDDFGR